MSPREFEKSELYLFKIFKIGIKIGASWFLLAFLVAWGLAAAYFPTHIKGLSTSLYWLMGILSAVGLFFSIVFHELSHSIVGRHYGIEIAGIKLFVFGGVSEMRNEPDNPKAEFLMSIAGPLCSFILAGVFYLLFYLGLALGWPAPIDGIIYYLALINLLLAIFNLLPGFPLDGGRILRSLLWWWKKDLKWATRVAYLCGSGIGLGLIFMGIFLFIWGALISGIWLFLIGFFLRRMAQLSYQNFLIKESFRNETLRKYTKTNPVTVPPDISLQELVDNYFYKYYHKLYPVVENNKLQGHVSFHEIKQYPQEKWPISKVKDIMHFSSETFVDVETPITEALQKMYEQKRSRLIVVDNGELYGVITLRDIMQAAAFKTGLDNL